MKTTTKVQYGMERNIKGLDGQYTNLEPLMDLNPDYLVEFSGRSTGKTTSALRLGLIHYLETGEAMGYIRRHKREFTGAQGDNLWTGLITMGWIEELTKGEYTTIHKYGARYYLANFDPDLGKVVPAEFPFCYAFALEDMQDYKSAKFNVGFIVFDEFITNDRYLKDEVSSFFNMVSTIVRDSGDVRIVLIGNTINRYNPYFKADALNIREARDMQTGEVWVFDHNTIMEDGRTINTRIVVRHGNNNTVNQGGKKSDKYFAHSQAKTARMILGQGWETGDYPLGYPEGETVNRRNIAWNFYVLFDDSVVEGLVVKGKYGPFLYFRESDVCDDDFDKDIAFFSLAETSRANFFNSLYSNHPALAMIGNLLSRNKAFFSSSDVGEVVKNFHNESLNTGI